MKVDLRFSHNYRVGILEELPYGKKKYYYPGGSTEGGNDGILVEINPLHGEPWVGVFAFGNINPYGISGVYSSPNPNQLCVVSKGAGYFVSATNPSDWSNVESIPIMDVHVAPSHNIIVFANHTELIAHGSSGMKWKTDRLAFDSFKIIESTNNYLKGEYYDIRSESKETFEVDLSTGKHIGSIY